MAPLLANILQSEDDSLKDAINPELRTALMTGQYDFLDVGSSNGSSLKLGVDRLGLTKGIGIDIDPKKVAKARALGHFVVLQDATKVALLPGSVRAVILSHFLEHLDSFQLAARCIRAAVQAATDFVFVRQPYFDASGPLMALDLKMYYSDWRGHRNLMTTYDIWRAFRPALDKGLIDLHIFGRGAVRSARDVALISLAAPADSGRTVTGDLERRCDEEFKFPVYREVLAIASRRGKDGRIKVDGRALAERMGNVVHIKSFGEA